MNTLNEAQLVALDEQLQAVNFDKATLAVENLERAWPAIRDAALRALRSENAYPKLLDQHRDALELLSGWIEAYSPSRYKAEHKADLAKKYAFLRELGEP